MSTNSLQITQQLTEAEQSALNQQLFEACSKNNIERITQLLKQGADPKIKNEYHQSLIFITLTHCKVVRGQQVIIRDEPQDIKKIQETLEILIKQDVDVNERSDYHPTSEDPIDYDDIPYNGYTPLMVACDMGIIPLVEFLLLRGAHVNQPGNSGQTPFLVSLKTGKIPLLKLLVKHAADFNHRDDNGFYPFRATYAHINPVVLRYLASIGSMCEIHPEDKARLNALRHQLPQNASYNLTQRNIISKHFLTLDSIEHLFYFARTGTLKVKQTIADFFNNGGDFNQRTCDGKLNTPLHIACGMGNIVALRALLAVLKQGDMDTQIAVLSAQNNQQETPLDVLAKYHPKLAPIMMDIIQPLIDPMLTLIKQFPIFENLPIDVINHLYPFYQKSPHSCFANHSEGVKLVTEMFEFASLNADFKLGLRYYNGYSEESDKAPIIDLKRAAVHFYRAAKCGHKEALYNLAICYRNGKGVKQSEKMALACYNRAAKAGLAGAAFKSAMMYRVGAENVPKNPEKSLQYLKQAAEGNIPEAIFMIKALGDGSLPFIKDAVSKDLPIAHFLLAERYEEGRGIESDLKLACEHYHYAAQNNIVEAQMRLEGCIRKLEFHTLQAMSQMPVQSPLTLSEDALASFEREIEQTVDSILLQKPVLVFYKASASSKAPDNCENSGTDLKMNTDKQKDFHIT